MPVSANPDVYNPRGVGFICTGTNHSFMRPIYKEIANSEPVYVVSANYHKNQYEITKDLIKHFSIRTNMITSTAGLKEISYKVLFNLFLDLHDEFVSVATGSKISPRSFNFCKIIFMEINQIITSDMEYFLMMYMYFLKSGMELPELFVVCPYISNSNRYICDILECKALELDPSQTDSEYNDYKTSDDVIDNIIKDITKKFYVIISTHKHTLPPDVREIRIEDIDNAVDPADITVRSACVMKDFDKIEYLVKIPGICIIIDPTVRIHVSGYYANNILSTKLSDPVYIKTMINFMLTLGSRPYIAVMTKQNPIEIRENSYINMALDILRFANKKINLRLLFEYYNKDPTIIERITNSYSILKGINFIEYNIPTQDSRYATDSQIYPETAKLLIHWKEKYPVFPMLLMISMICTAPKLVETKEHVISEVLDESMANNCKLGEIMSLYLREMEIARSAIIAISENEYIKRISNYLERLIKKFEIINDKTSESKSNTSKGLFNLNKFFDYLKDILIMNFSSKILTKNGKEYIGKVGNIKWTIGGSYPRY